MLPEPPGAVSLGFNKEYKGNCPGDPGAPGVLGLLLPIGPLGLLRLRSLLEPLGLLEGGRGSLRPTIFRLAPESSPKKKKSMEFAKCMVLARAFLLFSPQNL